MNDAFSSKIIWLATRFYWFAESSPANETIIKIYNIDKYGNAITSKLRTYTATTFKQAIELAFEVEEKRQ